MENNIWITEPEEHDVSESNQASETNLICKSNYLNTLIISDIVG